MWSFKLLTSVLHPLNVQEPLTIGEETFTNKNLLFVLFQYLDLSSICNVSDACKDYNVIERFNTNEIERIVRPTWDQFVNVFDGMTLKDGDEILQMVLFNDGVKPDFGTFSNLAVFLDNFNIGRVLNDNQLRQQFYNAISDENVYNVFEDIIECIGNLIRLLIKSEKERIDAGRQFNAFNSSLFVGIERGPGRLVLIHYWKYLKVVNN